MDAGYKKMLRGPETVGKVQKLLAQGVEMEAIAERLGISRQTVWRIKRMEKGNERPGTETDSAKDGD